MKTFHLMLGVGLALILAVATPLLPVTFAIDLIADLAEATPLAAVLFLLVIASLMAVRLLQQSPSARFAAPLTGRPELTSLA